MGERALYETPDERLKPEFVLAQARDLERRVLGTTSGLRPLFAVPHLRSGEGSATYHAYPLALTAVYQMRAALLHEHGHLTDNPKIGPDIARHCWEQGSRVTLPETIKALTGHALSPSAFIDHLHESVDEAVARARREMQIVSRLPRTDLDQVTLEADIRIVHGRETIADSSEDGLATLCDDYRAWIERLEEEKTSRPAS